MIDNGPKTLSQIHKLLKSPIYSNELSYLLTDINVTQELLKYMMVKQKIFTELDNYFVKIKTDWKYIYQSKFF